MKIDSSVVVERTVVPSVTIKISREDLWYQFMKSVADVIWTTAVNNDFIQIDLLRVANALTLPAKQITDYAYVISGLFEDYTALLLGDLMKEIDNTSVKHYEIIVTDGDTAPDMEPVIVRFDKIKF